MLDYGEKEPVDHHLEGENKIYSRFADDFDTNLDENFKF